MAASKDACFIKTFRAKIVPERLRSFVMPADGVVSNWIPADGRVQKDTIIATVNEDEIELERKELEVKILKDRIAKEEEFEGGTAICQQAGGRRGKGHPGFERQD